MTLERNDLLALLPAGLTAATVLAALAWTALRRSAGAVAAVSAAGLALAGGSIALAAGAAPHRVLLLGTDGFSLFFTGVLLALAIAVDLLAAAWLENLAEDREEFHVVLALATLGAVVVVQSRHFATFLLGLETLTVGLYTLLAYPRRQTDALVAGFRYLVLAGASSAILVFGAALLYRETGALELAGMARAAATASSPGAVAGAALFLVGFGFKLALAPFHLWTADVYGGAPAPAAAFVATVSKGAVLAVLLRFVAGASAGEASGLGIALAILAGASMFAGTLLALLARRVKRILAGSSIANLGYLTVGVLSASAVAVRATAFYFVAYAAATVAAFGVVGAVVRPGGDGDGDDLEDFRGLAWRRPAAGAVLGIALLSLAGLPVSAGFLAKVALADAGISASRSTLVLLLVGTSVIGLYPYLRVVATILAPAGSAASAPETASLSRLVLVALALLVLAAGVWPDPFLALIRLSLG